MPLLKNQHSHCITSDRIVITETLLASATMNSDSGDFEILESRQERDEEPSTSLAPSPPHQIPDNSDSISKEEMVFDYFDAPRSAGKLEQKKSFEMKTFDSSASCYRGRRFANNFSGRVEDPYSFENGRCGVQGLGVRNCLESDGNPGGCSSSYGRLCHDEDDDDDDDDLQQVVMDVSGHHNSRLSIQKAPTNPGDAITFFPKAIPNAKVHSMEPLSTGRADSHGELQVRNPTFNISAADGDETGSLVHMEGALKVQTSLGPPYLTTTSLMKPNGNPNDRVELEKRIQRRENKREQMRRKVAGECRSQDIPEYKGELPIEEVMAFIDNTKAQKGSGYAQKSQKKEEVKSKVSKSFDSAGKSCSLGASPNDSTDQERTPSSPPERIEDSSQTECGKKTQESGTSSFAPAGAMDEVSLPTSSSTSSFRTASPPTDTLLAIDHPEVERVPVHSPTVHKEFITVQKKKKLKQQHLGVQTNAVPSKVGVHYDPCGRQTSSKSFFGFPSRDVNLKNFSVSESRSDGNNNMVTPKNPPARAPFSEKKIPALDVEDHQPPKSETQFDPSHFPELSGGARRNSTGSSATKNSDGASKGFVFSYADIAAKLRQKKHSSDTRRRGSLQLTSDDIRVPARAKDPLKGHGDDPSVDEPLTSSNNSALCTEFDDCTISVVRARLEERKNESERKAAKALVVSSSSGESDVSQILEDHPKESSAPCDVNPRCKEPVVFLDGRKNPKVNDLVFIFDPSLPPGKKSCPAPEHFSDVTQIPMNPLVSESEVADYSSSQLSPELISAPHSAQQTPRPSPLSNNYPASRQVVKVSPMPIVPPEIPADCLKKSCDKGLEAKPCIDIGFLSPPIGDHLLTHPSKRNMFDLCRAQMFLYAGFEECVKESKNNPTNVVVYSE